MAGLHLSWNKLRNLKRWMKLFGTEHGKDVHCSEYSSVHSQNTYGQEIRRHIQNFACLLPEPGGHRNSLSDKHVAEVGCRGVSKYLRRIVTSYYGFWLLFRRKPIGEALLLDGFLSSFIHPPDSGASVQKEIGSPFTSLLGDIRCTERQTINKGARNL